MIDFLKARGRYSNRAHLATIAWRFLWYIPLIITKSFFLGVVAIGWGPSLALRINRAL